MRLDDEIIIDVRKIASSLNANKLSFDFADIVKASNIIERVDIDKNA